MLASGVSVDPGKVEAVMILERPNVNVTPQNLGVR